MKVAGRTVVRRHAQELVGEISRTCHYRGAKRLVVVYSVSGSIGRVPKVTRACAEVEKVREGGTGIVRRFH